MNPFLLIPILAAVIFIAQRVLKRPSQLSPKEAAAAVEAGIAVLVDVREPAEWSGGVVAVAAQLPLSDLVGSRRQWKSFLAANRSKRILLYCKSGIRSGKAASILKAEGFDTANMGAFSSLQAGGLPVR
jgi:rhodanese-related sulfurtransferase